MLIKHQVLQHIADGTVTLAFRRWKRPTVKTGGQLRTPFGVLAIDNVTIIDVDEITEEDAQKAGYSSRSELLKTLDNNGEGRTYRIKLHFVGQDPREMLKEQINLSDDELVEVQKTLTQLDLNSQDGSWTMTVLHLIEQHPGMRASELAALTHLNTQVLKVKVRKLKEMGLTESITRGGYKLSPRGCEILNRLDSSESKNKIMKNSCIDTYSIQNEVAVPVVAVIGKREVEQQTLSVRTRRAGEAGSLSLAELSEKLETTVAQKAIL